MNMLVLHAQERVYHVGQPLADLGEHFYRGFSEGVEVLIHLVPLQRAAALKREADLFERIVAPGIAQPMAYGTTEQHAFLIFAGEAEQPLASLLGTQELTPLAATDLLHQIAQRIATLHAAGIAWGHLTEQAFTITKYGQVRLVRLGAAGEPLAPQSGLSLEQATFLAPELSEDRQPSVAGDLYAWGVMAHLALLGKAPFTGATVAEVVMRHLADQPADVAKLRPELPAALVQFVNTALAKNPEERPQQAQALAEQLGLLVDELRAAEQAQMQPCPRCQTMVLPTTHCPYCQAPLQQAEQVRAPQRFTVIPLIAIALICIAVVVMLVGGRTGTSVTEAPDELTPIVPTATPVPTVSVAVAATAATPVASTPTPQANEEPGLLRLEAGDLADPNIDLVDVQVSFEPEVLIARLRVVGQIEGISEPRSYQVFLDTDEQASGERSTTWPDLRPDLQLLYRTGDEAGMVLQWDGAAWQGMAAIPVVIAGDQLVLELPLDWVEVGETIRYGVTTLNRRANLADYAPPLGESGQVIFRERAFLP